MTSVSGWGEVRPGRAPLWLALQWIDDDPQPRCLVNAALELVWANLTALDHFQEGRDIECHEGVVTISNPGKQAEFLDFVAGCERQVSTFCLPQDNGDGFLLFRAREVGREGEQRFFGITFHSSNHPVPGRYADLDRAFQLTPSEFRVVEKLANGNTTQEVAADLEVSIETIRSHLKHIYAKLDVTSREGLFSRIQAFRV